MGSKKTFRYTPHRGADAIKILAGTKTNATIRDVEETLEDIEEKEGTVTSIDKDKINGEGWTVKDGDGETYVCTCASNLYQLPETEEYGGMYYPTSNVSVKFVVNPVLRTNTITEILSLDEEEEQSLDLSKWKHGDKATTIIAKPKSAISVSNAIISFNYDNKNEVTADEDEVKTNGKKTNINTDTLDINSKNINIQGNSLDDYINGMIDTDINTQRGKNINVTQQGNLAQMNLNFITSVYIPAKKQRIIKDLKDPALFPTMKQKHPLLTGENVDELYIYPNGLVTVQTYGDLYRETSFLSTHNWITTPNIYKNLLKVTVIQLCDCCHTNIDGQQTYFNYCPYCKTWNTLYDNQGVIKCNACEHTWCEGCGHSHTEECSMNENDLKEYNNTWKISAIGIPCNYCKNDISYGKMREYANYCPKCHNWGYMILQTEYEDDEERRFLHCTSCGENYCVNCATSQGNSFITSFFGDQYYYYDDFIKKYFKMTHIRDD